MHPVLSRESPAAFTAAANILGDAACREVGLDAAWLSENDGRAQGLFEVARQSLIGAPKR